MLFWTNTCSLSLACKFVSLCSYLQSRNSEKRKCGLRLDYFYFYFVKKKCKSNPPGEPREHRLGEVLQGKSKPKLNIILSYLIVLFVRVQVSIIQTPFFQNGSLHNNNYLGAKKDLISKFLNWKFSNFLKFLFQSFLVLFNTNLWCLGLTID